MSNPDPRHDAENERADDDLLRAEDDFKRYEEEQELRQQRAKAASDAAAYADLGPRGSESWRTNTSNPELTPWGEDVASGNKAIAKQLRDKSRGVNR